MGLLNALTQDTEQEGAPNPTVSDLEEQIRQNSLRNLYKTCTKQQAETYRLRMQLDGVIEAKGDILPHGSMDVEKNESVGDWDQMSYASNRVHDVEGLPWNRGDTRSDILRHSETSGVHSQHIQVDPDEHAKASRLASDALLHIEEPSPSKSIIRRNPDDRASYKSSIGSGGTLPPMPGPASQKPNRLLLWLDVIGFGGEPTSVRLRLDHGTFVCVLARDAVEYLGLRTWRYPELIELRGVAPCSVYSDEVVRLEFQFFGCGEKFKAWFFVIPADYLTLCDGLLGENFINEHNFLLEGEILQRILQAKSAASGSNNE